MSTQLSILSILAKEGEGILLARRGLNLAVEKADRDNEGWSEKCYNLFLEWLKEKPVGFTFMVESFRNHIERNMKIETPHSRRAYGMVSKRALKDQLIKYFDTRPVKNATAHSARATVWIKL